jgi:hypothetical protein
MTQQSCFVGDARHLDKIEFQGAGSPSTNDMATAASGQRAMS